MPSTQPLCEGSLRWQEREWLREQGEEWWDDVFDRIACGVSPRDIAKEYCLRYAILVRVIDETDARRAEYERALQIASDGFAHEVVSIADDGSNDTYVDENGKQKVDTDVVARSKLRIDTRLKIAARWYRSRYGEKVDVNVSNVGLDTLLVQMEEARKARALPNPNEARVIEGHSKVVEEAQIV